MVEKVDPQADPTSPKTNTRSMRPASSVDLQPLPNDLIEQIFRRISRISCILGLSRKPKLRVLLFSCLLNDPENGDLYLAMIPEDGIKPKQYVDELRKTLVPALAEKSLKDRERFVSNLRYMEHAVDLGLAVATMDYQRQDMNDSLAAGSPLSNSPESGGGSGEVQPVATRVDTPTTGTTQPTPSRYIFIPRHAVISLCAATGFWTFLVSMASLTAHAFPWPLAVIAGFGLLPLAISGGIQRRA